MTVIVLDTDDPELVCSALEEVQQMASRGHLNGAGVFVPGAQGDYQVHGDYQIGLRGAPGVEGRYLAEILHFDADGLIAPPKED